MPRIDPLNEFLHCLAHEIFGSDSTFLRWTSCTLSSGQTTVQHLLKPSLPTVPGGGQPDLASEPLLMPRPGPRGDLRRLVHLQRLPAAIVATVAALPATVWTHFQFLHPDPRSLGTGARPRLTPALSCSLTRLNAASRPAFVAPSSGPRAAMADSRTLAALASSRRG